MPSIRASRAIVRASLVTATDSVASRGAASLEGLFSGGGVEGSCSILEIESKSLSQASLGHFVANADMGMILDIVFEAFDSAQICRFWR